MEQEFVSMQVVNPQAAGVDVGSRSHWVAVGQSEKDVREYGVFNQDLFALADWLKEKDVKTVAMESTGTYWQNLYAVLISKGLHVVLCNGKFTKNIKGKKTDIKDCQWIQKLHTLGLLTSSFLPDGKTEELRTYCRQRANLLHLAASTSKKMQKNLRLLNLRLDVVVKDICGLTGLLIIRAICDGETDPEKLASFRHGNCRKSEEEIAKALQTNGRKDYLFALQQELDTYDHLQNKIDECDKEIDKMLNEIIQSDDNKRQHFIDAKPHKRVNKNTPKDIDLNLKSYQMFEGTDLLAIEGMSYSTVLALMSEVGLEGIRKFKTAKHFASWLRLAPNNKVSGGKVLSSKVPKGSNRLKIALRNAANAIGNLKDSTPLRDFFHRISFRKGRVSAISATARKLAVIIWNMVVKGVPYINPEGYLFLDQKRKLGLVKRIKKQIDKFGLTNADLRLEIEPI
ncbi:IS110 family RNA-guided transposase [Cyclobacterium marinum]|uniref:IS110 family transposase n=1 Tax=Cyclobacterium marinum TaxID=104 RepID=UPI0011ED5A04|nr:IS110 family transposase [Cyclobacterium marinum]MBI0397559.1 IS110 family transposase [Cyclobacterium marinum]MBI0400593.1 IS110 family transposase [Cyclobacterium marinum]MBI0400768.1 IS110 family transposase [Cyclobacterium marinum]